MKHVEEFPKEIHTHPNPIDEPIIMVTKPTIIDRLGFT